MDKIGYEISSVGQKPVKQYEPKTSLKGYLVDTSARILFYIPMIAAWEKFVAGMENPEVLKSRLTGICVNLFVGRVHGLTRQYVEKLTGTTEESSELRKFLADTFTGFAIGAATYPIALGVAGVSWGEALAAAPFAIGVTALGGRPFGMFANWYRKLFGLKPVY